MRSSLGVASALLLGGGLLAGCAPSDVHLAVSPGTSAFDEPLTIEIGGLHDHEHVTLRLTETDGLGVDWRSTLGATADDHGRLRTTDVHLVSRLATVSGKPAYFRAKGAWVEHVEVLDGDHVLARGGATRHDAAQDVLTRRTRLTLAHDGLYGEIYRPRAHVPTRSAVVAFGGSEGGIGLTPAIAGALAARGHPTLALAYFGEPGLPKTLTNVPLEYFARAVRRLARVPGVDPKRIFLSGVSRGSEAALLTAIHFPGLVHGVYAGVPNDVSGPDLPGLDGPAWTLHGKPLPYALPGDVRDHPRALLAIGRFPGRVLLSCGGQDQEWPSCPQAEVLLARDPDRVTLLRYPDAGHFVGSLLPGLADTDSTAYGGTPEADQLGHYDAWPKFLAFLDR